MNDRMITSVPAERLAIEPKFEIKKLRGMEGTDGPAYSCELWLNDKHVANVVNSGMGGCTDYFWRTGEAQAVVEAYVAALPLDMPDGTWTEWERKAWPQGRKIDLDSFVAGLCDEHEEGQHIRKMCKVKTVFTLISDPDHLRFVKSPYAPAVVAYLKKKYAGDLKEILNENPKYASIERN